MHLLQLGRRQRNGLHALVEQDLVGRSQLLEQPEDALGARIVEMMDLQHGAAPGGPAAMRTGAARGSKSKVRELRHPAAAGACPGFCPKNTASILLPSGSKTN